MGGKCAVSFFKQKEGENIGKLAEKNTLSKSEPAWHQVSSY